MLKLNLGCGEDIREGYHNIDIRKLPNVIVADVTNLPYKNNSVDEIIASDVYEHISHTKSLEVLKHWYDLLKPGGGIIVRAPCLDTIIQYFMQAKTLVDVKIGIDLLYGGQDYFENSHYTVCHVNLMNEFLKSIGFKNINYKFEGHNVLFRAFKTFDISEDKVNVL